MCASVPLSFWTIPCRSELSAELTVLTLPQIRLTYWNFSLLSQRTDAAAQRWLLWRAFTGSKYNRRSSKLSSKWTFFLIHFLHLTFSHSSQFCFCFFSNAVMSFQCTFFLSFSEQLWSEDTDQAGPHELPRNCYDRIRVGLGTVGSHRWCDPLSGKSSQSFRGEFALKTQLKSKQVCFLMFLWRFS